MSSGIRLFFGALLGLIAGIVVSRWIFPPPARVQPLAVADNVISRPPHPPVQEWEQWLALEVPWLPAQDADEFWSRLDRPKAATMDARHRLMIEESLWGLPPPQLLAVLTDEKFCRLSELWDHRVHLVWTNLLMQAGLPDAMRAADRLPSASMVQQLQDALSERLTRTDPETGFEWFCNRPDRMNPIANYLAAVARTDIGKATELWNRLDSEAVREFAARNILQTLVRHDWRTAFDWARTHSPAASRDSYISWVFENLPGPQLDSAQAVAAEMTDPALRSLAMGGVLAARLRTQPVDQIVDQALALPAGSLDEKGWALLGGTVASYKLNRTEPSASAEQLRAIAARLPMEGRDSFLTQAAMRAGLNDPPLASRLFEYLTSATGRTMAEKWASEDPAAASAWLAGLPPSPKRDEAVAGFCRGLAPIEPAAAAEWALQLQSKSVRDQAVNDVLGAWRQADPTGAAAWAATHGMAEPVH